jgi:hypothetical protein
VIGAELMRRRQSDETPGAVFETKLRRVAQHLDRRFPPEQAGSKYLAMQRLRESLQSTIFMRTYLPSSLYSKIFVRQMWTM